MPISAAGKKKVIFPKDFFVFRLCIQRGGGKKRWLIFFLFLFSLLFSEVARMLEAMGVDR